MSQGSRRDRRRAIGTRLGAKAWVPDAVADPTAKAAVVSIFFEGGFNALFTSADSFLGQGTFGVGALTTKKVGNDLFVDSGTIGSLGDWALGHMAAIGNGHGATDHVSAQRNNFTDGTRSYVVQLAAAMGGSAAFKAAAMGSLPTPGPSIGEGGVSLQLLRTMTDVETALGIGPVDMKRPARNAAANANMHARDMSRAMIAKNPRSLPFAKDGYDTVVESLGKQPIAIDVAKVAQAYGSREGTNLDSVPAKLAAAELMIRSGTNVVTLSDTGWDTHGDEAARPFDAGWAPRSCRAEDVPLSDPSEPELATMNISVILHGDFARSLPGSDHAPALSALVIGPNVKVGTTGRVSADVTLPPASARHARCGLTSPRSPR